jgi:5-methylcytosine-specific restriction protein B
MAIPTIEELNLPVLQELAQGPMTTAELESALAKRFHLTDEERKQRKKPSSPQPTFINHILWSVGAWMGTAGLVTKMPARAGKTVYGITEFGTSVLSAPPPSISHEWLIEHSPEYAAKHRAGERKKPKARAQNNRLLFDKTSAPPLSAPTSPSYGVDNIIDDGCFHPRADIVEAVELLRDKKNLVLQGPPGTGKTWLAKRLGYALLGTGDSKRVLAVQFHPSLSYEDFVRGLRFSKEAGRLDLVDGVFLDAAKEAESNPDQPFVLVIEEINRGNPAQILGELLTLLEADKRVATEALRLTYPRRRDERFFIPPNLYVVGTMNTADRSLALVDLALRRRFAFVDLEPQLNEEWRQWCRDRGMPEDLITSIANKLRALNGQINEHRSLGPQFRIGHSFVTPERDNINPRGGWSVWLKRVVNSTICPLLIDYWYDDGPTASREIEKLREGL